MKKLLIVLVALSSISLFAQTRIPLKEPGLSVVGFEKLPYKKIGSCEGFPSKIRSSAIESDKVYIALLLKKNIALNNLVLKLKNVAKDEEVKELVSNILKVANELASTVQITIVDGEDNRLYLTISIIKFGKTSQDLIMQFTSSECGATWDVGGEWASINGRAYDGAYTTQEILYKEIDSIDLKSIVLKHLEDLYKSIPIIDYELN